MSKYSLTMQVSDRQMEIIEAAGKILTSSGVSGLTIKNLAKEMDFSESALYRHFNSKEEIILTMLKYLVENMNSRLAQTSLENGSPEENFKALFNNQFTFFRSNPHFVVAVFSDGLMEESQSINAIILQLMGLKKKFLLPIILKGQQQGIFTKELNSEELLHIILGAFRLQMLKWKIAQFEFDIVSSGQKMVLSLLKILKNK